MADQDRERELEKLSLGKPSLFPRHKKKGATPAPEPDAPASTAIDRGPQASKPAPTREPIRPEPAPAPAPMTAVSPATEPAVPSDETSRPWWAGAVASVRRPTRSRSEQGTGSHVAAEPTEPREPREPWVPPVTGMRAVAVVGLVAGLLIVGLTIGSLQLCEAVRGTASCGGAGYFFLIAIVVGVALLGGLALAALEVSDPRGTSVLAVGVVTVVILALLVPVIFSWTMVVVIPVISVVAFLGSHWLTTVTVDENPAWKEPAERDDAVLR